MRIIGLSGYARTGKDEFAAVLIEEFDFIKIGFADILRKAVYELNPLVDVEIEDYEVNVGIEDRIVRSGHTEQPLYLKDIVDQEGWEGYKETIYKDEIRRLLQRMGTEVGRNLIDENVWVDAAFNSVSDDAKVVVTDMRFPNEAKAVRDRGGLCIRIHRPGVGPINDHPSETSLDDYPFDYHVDNDGDLDDYREMIRKSGIV